jgi:REP element-mobilizing transposase RayT
MARSIRLQYPGAFYHVMARGNRRESIFRDDDDRRFFLHTLAEACGKTGWRIHAWVLMGNHYHLMLETPEPNLVDGMQWLQNTYTRRFNTRHRLWGRLFGDRYKAIPTEGRTGEYYCGLMDYLHLNPIRAGLVKPRQDQSILDYLWSSAASGYALPPRRRPSWLAAADGLAAFGFPENTEGRRRFIERLDGRAAEEARQRCGLPPLPPDARGGHLRRGWYWGSQAFAETLLTLAASAIRKAQNRTYRSGPLHRAHRAARAEALLTAGLRAAALALEDLPRLRGNDPRKTTIALNVWRETHIPMSWLAERLHMHSAANVSQILRRARAATTPPSGYVD